MNHVREVPCHVITETIKKLFIEANTLLGNDVLSALEEAKDQEDSELGRYVLTQIIKNADIAKAENMPLCQDTGLAIVFVEMGQDVHVVGGNFNEAIQEGVRQAYKEGFLRKSICDPLSRVNTDDNTPAIIHIDIVKGNKIKLIAMPKGSGSENMSRAAMLVPLVGAEGIKRYILERVLKAGPNPCPPTVVGVGIGGSIEQASILAKKALLRPIGKPNKYDKRLGKMEKEILEEVNALGIGPQGFGGKTTALAVHIEMMPCHIASLPIAVNLQCHVARHREAVL
jgi:fumarate hydratase subunit alpha